MFIINPFVFGVGGSGPDITFDPANYQSDRLTLSLLNKKADRTTGGGSTPGLARATVSKSSGKWYCEILCDFSASGLLGIGLVNASQNVSPAGTLFLGESVNGWGYWADGALWYNNVATSGWGLTWSATDVIAIAWDQAAGYVWFAKNNAWQASGNPAAGTNPAFTGVTAQVWPAIDCYGISAGGTIRDSTIYSYSPPSGFSAWQA